MLLGDPVDVCGDESSLTSNISLVLDVGIAGDLRDDVDDAGSSSTSRKTRVVVIDDSAL
jgi:hypothetical protein